MSLIQRCPYFRRAFKKGSTVYLLATVQTAAVTWFHSPVGEGALPAAGGPAEVGPQLHPGLQRGVAHHRGPLTLGTQAHGEADPVGDHDGQLVAESGRTGVEEEEREAR